MKYRDNCLFIFTLKYIDEKYIQYLLGRPEEKRILNRGINRKKILKWIIIKYSVRICTRVIWFNRVHCRHL
jgi:hypothetical protein